MLEVTVKHWYLDITQGLSGLFVFQGGPFREGVRKLHNVPDYVYDQSGAVRLLDRKSDLGPFFATYQFDGVLCPHAGNINGLAVAFPDLKDQVIGKELSLQIGRAAGDDAHYLYIPIFLGK